jgi:hypothetical protein
MIMEQTITDWQTAHQEKEMQPGADIGCASEPDYGLEGPAARPR